MRWHRIIFKKMAGLSIENQFHHEIKDLSISVEMLEYFLRKKRIVYHRSDVLSSIESS